MYLNIMEIQLTIVPKESSTLCDMRFNIPRVATHVNLPIDNPSIMFLYSFSMASEPMLSYDSACKESTGS